MKRVASCHLHIPQRSGIKPICHENDQTTKRPNDQTTDRLSNIRRRIAGATSVCFASAFVFMLASAFTPAPEMPPPPVFGAGNTTSCTFDVRVYYSTGLILTFVTYSVPPGGGSWTLPAGAVVIDHVRVYYSGTMIANELCTSQDHEPFTVCSGGCIGFGPDPSGCSTGSGIKIGPSPC